MLTACLCSAQFILKNRAEQSWAEHPIKPRIEKALVLCFQAVMAQLWRQQLIDYTSFPR